MPRGPPRHENDRGFEKVRAAYFDGKDRRGRPARFIQAEAAASQENYHLLKQREDGDRFKPTDTAEAIATMLVGMFSVTKAEDIFRRGSREAQKRKTV